MIVTKQTIVSTIYKILKKDKLLFKIFKTNGSLILLLWIVSMPPL